ncbi:hypothetical protein MMC07_004485 [Pseudocyphellaria aurata]|nr:hypothetical protein [Pseudocyphellaria aurata]
MLSHFFLWLLFSLATSIQPASTDQGPAELLNGSSAAAIQFGGDVRIYYQAIDGSIHESRSYAPNSVKYLDTFLVPSFKVRPGTPLAAVGASTNYLGDHSVYYISPDNYLRGYCWEGNREFNWFDCSLNDAKFSVLPGSRYLYAVDVPNGPLRIGYQCNSGSICEASSFRHSSEWHTHEV